MFDDRTQQKPKRDLALRRRIDSEPRTFGNDAAPGGRSLRMFRISSRDDAGQTVSYEGKLQAALKDSAGYGGWEDEDSEADDATLRDPIEESVPGLSSYQVDEHVWAARVRVDDGDSEWWIVGRAGLPKGEGQYKGLFLDANDEWHVDYARAHS